MPEFLSEPASASASIARLVLDTIADKTGYPADMLELSMSLDADLGIDSIKRVEILSALQEQLPGVPEIQPQELGELENVQDIVELLGETEPGAAAVEGPPAASGEDSPSRADRQSGTAPALSADASGESLARLVMDCVAEKTGYPTEMLELEMSLDVDLGIDSIKRVEILSALQDRLPDAPAVAPEALGELQTLADICRHLALATDPPLEAPPANPTEGTPDPTEPPVPPPSSELTRLVLTTRELPAEPARTPLTLSPSATVCVTDDGTQVARSVVDEFRSRGLYAELFAVDCARIQPHTSGLVIIAPPDAGSRLIADAFKLIRTASSSLRSAGRTSAAGLMGICRIDGAFGLGPEAAAGDTSQRPFTGGLAGLVKTAAREWPDVSCKVLDLADDLVAHGPTVARLIVDEFLLVGPAEVGLSGAGRCETTLRPSPLNGTGGPSPIAKEDLVVITGGARGITAKVTIELARQWRPSMLLLGRSSLDFEEPSWLDGVRDTTQVKRLIAEHWPEAEAATPLAIERQCRRILSNREVNDALDALDELGAPCMYRSVDVRDRGAMSQVIAEARAEFGPVRGIVHGAGVLADRRIEDKTDQQFDEVYSTKVEGFAALLQAINGDELKVLSLFSSSTGRFGRAGQSDYAAANEVLNKLAQQQARIRPRCRVVSFNWGPWDGGMVTPELKRRFEAEGVGVIPLDAGAQQVVRELASPCGGPVEIVLTGPTTPTAS